MRSAEDRAARGNRIGSTDVPAILGLSAHRTAIDVYRAAVEGWEPEETELMEIGTALEPVILGLYKKRTGRLLGHPGQLLHPEYEFLVDTPDAVAQGDLYEPLRAVEAKSCVGFQADRFGEPGTDEIPDGYIAQAQVHLLHLRALHGNAPGYEVCDVPVLIGGFKFQLYEVRWDAKLASNLVDAARDFWTNHIVPRIPPPVDGSASYTDFLRAQWPANTSPLRPAPPEAAAFAAQYREWRGARKVSKDEQDKVANQLRALIGSAEGIQGEGWKATWKATKSKTRTLRVTFEGDDDE